MEDTSSWRHYRFLSHNDVVGFATVDKNDIVQRQYSITRASQALVAAGPHTTMYYLRANRQLETWAIWRKWLRKSGKLIFFCYFLFSFSSTALAVYWSSRNLSSYTIPWFVCLLTHSHNLNLFVLSRFNYSPNTTAAATYEFRHFDHNAIYRLRLPAATAAANCHHDDRCLLPWPLSWPVLSWMQLPTAIATTGHRHWHLTPTLTAEATSYRNCFTFPLSALFFVNHLELP